MIDETGWMLVLPLLTQLYRIDGVRKHYTEQHGSNRMMFISLGDVISSGVVGGVSPHRLC